MSLVAAKMKQVLADESGATIVEYGVLVLGVIGFAAFAMTQMKSTMTTLFDTINSKISSSPFPE